MITRAPSRGPSNLATNLLADLVRHAAAVGIAHLVVQAGSGLNAWRLARRSLRLRALRDVHGRQVVWRESRVTPQTSDLPPIVCLPGLCVSSRYMVPLMHALAPHARVYCPHPPGHAGSDPLREVSVRAYADAVRDWLDAMALPRVALLANSMGCQVALQLAASHPQLVSHCVLIGPTADMRARSRRVQALRLLRSIPFDQRAIDSVVLTDYLSSGPRIGLAELTAMLDDTPEQVAPRVQCPVLYMRGAHDAIAPRTWLAELLRLTPDASCFEIPHTGHAAHFSGAPVVAHHALSFFRSRNPSNASNTPSSRFFRTLSQA